MIPRYALGNWWGVVNITYDDVSTTELLKKVLKRKKIPLAVMLFRFMIGITVM